MLHVAGDRDVSLLEVVVGVVIQYEQADCVQVGLDHRRQFVVVELVDVDAVHLDDAVAVAQAGGRCRRRGVDAADHVVCAAVSCVNVEPVATSVVPRVDDAQSGEVRVKFCVNYKSTSTHMWPHIVA